MVYGGKNVVLILNFLFSTAFLIHISILIYYIIYPEVPEIVVYQKNLKEIDFPMNVRICAHELNDSKTRYRKFGYKNGYSFFMGSSMFNKSLYGWAGHSENGSVLGNIEGKQSFRIRLYIANLLHDRYSCWSLFQLD